MTDIDTLIRALSDPDAKVRKDAAWALGDAASEGTDITPAMPALINALSDPDSRVRDNAAWALGRAMANEKSRDAALHALINALSDPNGYVRGHAAWALERAAEKGIPIDLEKVGESLKAAVDRVRETHEEALIRNAKRGGAEWYLSLVHRISKSRQKMDMGGEMLTERPKPPKGHDGLYRMGRLTA